MASIFVMTTKASAQSVSIENVTNFGFDGVHSINEKMYYIFTGVEGSFDDRELILISPELEVLARHKLTLGRLVEVSAVAANENSVLFYIAADKIGHLYLYDFAGKELQHREIEAPSNSLNTAELFSAGTDGFFLVKQIKPKKVGFSVELLSSTLETKWQKDYAEEKDKLELITSTGDKNQIAVVYEKDKLIEAVCLGLDGEEKYKKGITHTDPEMILKPSHAAFNANGSLAVFGDFEEKSMLKYTGQRYRYFITAFDPSGTSLFFNAKPWEEAEIQQLKNQSAFPMYSDGKSPDFYIHAFHPTTTGFEIIGETFRFVDASHEDYPIVGGGKKVEGSDMPSIYSKPAFFFAMDLIVASYDMKGNLVQFKRTGRPVKRTETMGPINAQKPLSTANELVEFGRFNYRFSGKNAEGNPVYISLGQHFDNLYTGFIRSDDAYDNIFTRDYLEISIQKSRGKGEQTSAQYTKEDLGYKTLATNNWMMQTDILPSANVGQYVLMELNGRKLTLTKKAVEPEINPNTLKGVPTQRIQYWTVFDNQLCVLYFSETGDNGENWVMLLLDQELNIKNKQQLVIPKDAQDLRLLSNDNSILISASLSKGADYTLLLDKNGNPIKTQILNPVDNLSKTRNNAIWYLADNQGYYCMHKIGNGTESGYDIRFFDTNLNQKWSKSYLDAASLQYSYEVVGSNANGLLIKERIRSKEDQLAANFSFRQERFVEINTEGMRTEKNDLLTDKEWRQSIVHTADNQNQFYTAGVHFSENDEKIWESGGLWLQPLNQSVNTEILSWQKIAAAFESPGLEANLKKGELQFRLLALTEAEGNLILLTELIAYDNASTNPFQYAVNKGVLSDFIVFKFDKSGAYTNSYFIEKTPLNLTTVSNAMNNFSFQYLTNGGKDLVFIDLANDLEPYAVSTPISAVESRTFLVAHARMNDNAKTEVDAVRQTEFEKSLDSLSTKIDRIDQKITKYTAWLDKTDDKKPTAPKYEFKAHTGFVNGGTASIFVYHYDSEKGRLRLASRRMN